MGQGPAFTARFLKNHPRGLTSISNPNLEELSTNGTSIYDQTWASRLNLKLDLGLKPVLETLPHTGSDGISSPSRTAKKAEAVASNQTLCPPFISLLHIHSPCILANLTFSPLLSSSFVLFHYPSFSFSQRTQVSLVDRVSIPETWDSWVIWQHILTSLFSSPTPCPCHVPSLFTILFVRLLS